MTAPALLKYLHEALNLNSDIPEYLAIAAVVHNQFGEKDRGPRMAGEGAGPRVFPSRNPGISRARQFAG